MKRSLEPRPQLLPLILCGLICLFATSSVWSQKERFQTAIDQWVGDPVFTGATIGFAMLDLGTGQTVAAHQPQMMLTPASTMKIWTTAAALARFGPQHRIETHLLYDGSIKNGILNGNLYIKGYGDPTLASSKIGQQTLDKLLDSWYEMVKKAGIKSITGDVIGDDTFFEMPPESPSWNWSDLGNYYGAGAWALNILDNEFTITFKQSKGIGSIPTILETSPKIPGLQLVNEVTSGPAGSGDNAYIYAAPYQKERIIRGTIPEGSGTFTIRGSLPNPPEQAAFLLRSYLESKGIQTAGSARAISNSFYAADHQGGTTLIGKLESPPLIDIIKITNQDSNNIFAEALFKLLSESAGSHTHTQQGSQWIKQWLSDFKIDTTYLNIIDGSGLARTNALSAESMVRSLYYISGQPYYQDFLSSLATPGGRGTLKNRFAKTPPGTKIMAKSGTLSRVKTYAGYLFTVDGGTYAFSIMVNQYKMNSSAMNAKMDQLLQQLAAKS
jgi:D-alanyl-D-alanine carboxypeptidase/D-alanyl-D-alanine-endopeptidase (penicillin-binding protein 4)